MSTSTKNDPSDPSDGRPKVVHVSIVHRANDVRVFGKECRSIAAAGYAVVLYARTDREHEIDGVRVRPVSQATSRIRRMTTGVWGLLGPLLAERADIYHFHDPELLPLGIVLRLRGKVVVYDAHEDLPAQVLGKQWIPGPLRSIVAGLSWLLVRTFGRGFNAVIAATPTVAKAYGSDRTDVVHNYPILVDDGRFVPYDERPNDLAYVGGISELRGLTTMLEMLPVVRERFPDARLHLVGPPLHAVEIPPLDGVEVHGLLPPTEARRVMGSCRVGLAILKPTKAHEDSIPNKLFEYMAETLPVVASNFPLWTTILNESQAGVVVDPDDPRAVADAVLGMLADPEAAAEMGERGRKSVLATYSWDSEAATLLARYAALLRKNRE